MAETKTVNLNVETNLGSLKSQLKEAQRDVEKLSEKFGATSVEATNAARKAAQLKDAIGDAKALTDAFNPDAKFNAFSSALQGVAGGFSAVQGAMGLVGVESKDVENAILKVQSAMALSQGINSIMGAKDAFTNLAAQIGKTAIGQKALNVVQIIGTTIMKGLNFVMKQNPILLIISGITAAIAAFKFFSNSTETATEKNEKLNASLERQEKALERNSSFIKQSGENRLKILVAQGASEQAIHEQTLKNLTNDEKARQKNVDFLREKLKEKRAILKQAYIDEDDDLIKSVKKELSETKGKYIDLVSQKKNNITNIRVEEITYKNKVKKDEEETTAKQKEENQKKIDANKARLNKIAEDKKAKELEDFKIEQDRLKNLKNLENQYLAEKEQAENDYYNSKLTAEQLEVQNTQDKYFSLIEQARIYGQDSAILEQAQKDDLAAINNKYRDEDKKTQDEIDAKKKENDLKKIEEEKALQDKKIQMALTGLSILQDATTLLTAKNEKDARRQFKISKALSLSTAIINTGLAVTAALTAGGNPIKLATGMQFVEAGIAAATGGINIAKISATQFGGFGTAPEKPANPTDKGTSGGNVITPNFNIVGNNGTNQLKQLQQAPIQAYVVSGEMSTQQSLDRNRLRNATL